MGYNQSVVYDGPINPPYTPHVVLEILEALGVHHEVIGGQDRANGKLIVSIQGPYNGVNIHCSLCLPLNSTGRATIALRVIGDNERKVREAQSELEKKLKDRPIR